MDSIQFIYCLESGITTSHDYQMATSVPAGSWAYFVGFTRPWKMVGAKLGIPSWESQYFEHAPAQLRACVLLMGYPL
jgi:hypothetical protein